MPIYEYQCKQCGHQLEAIQRFSDAALTQCPSCHQQALSKLMSAPSFRLKGGGWYETDFKTANKRHGTQDGDGGAAAGKPDAGKTDTSKTDTSKTDISKTDSSKTESSKTDGNKTGGSKTDSSKNDNSKKDSSKKDSSSASV